MDRKVLLLVGALVGCADRTTADSCDVVEHLDTAGLVKVCACACDDEALRCGPWIPACWEDDSEESSSTARAADHSPATPYVRAGELAPYVRALEQTGEHS